MGIELTNEQVELVGKIQDWYHKGTKQHFAYSGAAGTGKTTCIKAAIEALGIRNYHACAYVGKAVNVLSSHGLPASTIHSMIYKVAWVPQRDEKGRVMKDSLGRLKMKMQMVLRDHIEGNPELLIVDEATMVNDEMAKEILSFGIPTVFIGDNNQLPPVFGESTIMNNVDYTLHKIMRQAEDDPIVFLSQLILADRELQVGNYGKSQVLEGYDINKRSTLYDVILTGKNNIRDYVNFKMRSEILGLPKEPQIGDKIICRQNNWGRHLAGGIYLTTGTMGRITDIYKNTWGKKSVQIDFKPDFIADDEFRKVKMDLEYLYLPSDMKKQYGFNELDKFDWAYCVTVHSMQGSESPRVLYLDQRFYDYEMTKKLRYTAITRATDQITFAKNYYPAIY